MKNKKLLKVLAAVTMSAAAVAGSVTLFGCGHTHTFSDQWKNDDPSGHWYEATCEHTDEKKDFAPHVYSGDKDGDCDVCGYVRHEFDTTQKIIGFEGHYNPCIYDGCEEQGNLTPHTFGADNICTDPDCGQRYASAEFKPDDLEATTYAEGFTSGFFTILPGTTVRTRSRLNYNVYDHKNGEGDASSAPIATGFSATKSIQYNGSARGFSVKAPAPGKLTVYLDNGSGGKTKQDKQTVLLTKPDGSTEVISYYCGDMYAVTINCKTAGVYKITRGDQSGVGTTDVYYAKFETVVPVTPIEKIEISNKGKTSYIKGQEFDKSALTVDVVYSETGVKLPLDLTDPNVTVDITAFDSTKAGTYTITISYDAEGKSFTDSYEVVVKEVQALKLGFNKIVKEGNTAAGNGQYINHALKQFYFKGEALNLDGLTVKTIMDEEGKEEVIVTEGYTVKGFNANTSGKQTLTVEWDDNPAITATFDVYVASYALADVNVTKDITINVNKDLEDNKVGELENGAYQFKTIQQSLDFLNGLNGDNSKKLDNYKKVINLAEGTYKEKLEVNIPNLTIRGADLEHPEKTVIEWDSLVGIPDESGYINETDTTATLNVREKAIGFVIEGVTVSNWYNSTEHFDEKFGAGYGEHRALAMLIQADKVVIDNCRLLGYQDTIELFTGRQLIQNTYICGRTDFIFGTNNTTYFKNCEIESIVDGGYVTAFKGCNKGDGDWVQYGAIFDECNFTAPAAVVAKKDTSLGRTWAKYAAVAYVNCNFDGHISTTPYSSAKGTRYTAMSGAEPTDATVKFVEYNNTGAGAVTTQVAGMTLITDATEGAKYSTMSVFFGETNGKVTYKDTWDGSKGVEITTTDYRFDAEAFPDGNVSVKDADAVTQIFNGDMTVHGAWHTELSTPEQSKDFGWFSAGTTITVNKPGKVFVTTYGHPYGTPENVKISYVNNMATITIVATEDEPIANGCCITLIEIDSAQKGAHTHAYGEWVIDTPSESAKGSAVKTCENCESTPAHSVTVELPVLSATNYELTAAQQKVTLLTPIRPKTAKKSYSKRLRPQATTCTTTAVG